MAGLAPQPARPGLLYGLPAIAAFLELPLPEANRLLDRGVLPIFRVGGRPCSTRAILTDWLRAFAAAALEGAASSPAGHVTVRIEVAAASRKPDRVAPR